MSFDCPRSQRKLIAALQKTIAKNLSCIRIKFYAYCRAFFTAKATVESAADEFDGVEVDEFLFEAGGYVFLH